MPFCTQCGSGVSGESCSNCGAENPHFRDPNAEPEIVPTPSVFAPVKIEHLRPWGLIESSLALAWPRMRKNAVWAIVIIAINLLVTTFVLPKMALVSKPPTAPAELGHYYGKIAIVILIALAESFAIKFLALGEAARARIPEFRWTPGSIGALIGWWLLAGIGLSLVTGIAATIVLIPAVLMMIPHTGGGAAASAVSPQGAFMIGMTVLVVLAPLVMLLGTKIALIAPSFVLGERSNPIGASWKLTGGYFWETLGFYLLYLLVGIGIFVISLGIRAFVVSLNKNLAAIGDFLQIAGSFWLQFALVEGMLAWTVMLREAKLSGRQG